MAVAAAVLLLVAITSSVHSEVIQRAGRSHRFILNKTADFCCISRWTREEEELLWNSSVSHDSSQERDASYEISSLKVSDSGQYLEQCWTQRNLTHERKSTLLVCDTQQTRDQHLYPYVGQTVELTCDGVGPNQSVQWALEYRNHKIEMLELASVDEGRSSVYKLQPVKNQSSLLVTVDRPLGFMSYYCLERSRQRCDFLRRFTVHVPPERVYCSVGESLELNCSGLRGNKPHVWRLSNSLKSGEESHNSSLVFPSLTLNHSGRYICQHSDLYREFYDLYVCPEHAPPAVAFFTGAQNLTLQCGDWRQAGDVRWFMRSNRTEGRAARVRNNQQFDNMHLSNVSLVITNISLEDSGEFWCVVMKDRRCVFRSETLVRFREPEVDHHLVRSVLVSAAIMVMCVLIVAVVRRNRGREQLPVPVEEVQMSDLSPASADLLLETLV